MAKNIDYSFETCDCVCDHCNELVFVESTNYNYINQELKDYGWKIMKINNNWVEFCSDECAKKYISKNRGE